MSETIKFALAFPQGHILFMESINQYSSEDIGKVYFMPTDADSAYMVWGSRKELFGKKAIEVAADKGIDVPAYNIVYEFNDTGALHDARLVQKDNTTTKGTLADEQFVQVVQAAIDAGAMTFFDPHTTRPLTVYNAARFPDGRLLVQLFEEADLYIGTPGNFTKVDAFNNVSGGGSRYYKTPTGGKIEMPWGYKEPLVGQPPKYDEQELEWDLRITQGTDPATIGLKLASGPKFLNPFSAEVQPPAAKKDDAPKPPKA